jgi:hypothetical protein
VGQEAAWVRKTKNERISALYDVVRCSCHSPWRVGGARLGHGDPEPAVDRGAGEWAVNKSNAACGTPAKATFGRSNSGSGRCTWASDTARPPCGGPHAADATSVRLVLTTDNLSGLGTRSITPGFNGATPGSASLASADFAGGSANEFPSPIASIANDAVNAIRFTDRNAQHAAADILSGTAPTRNAVLGNVTIASQMDLRIDVFADALGKGRERMIGNAANSGRIRIEDRTNNCRTTTGDALQSSTRQRVHGTHEGGDELSQAGASGERSGHGNVRNRIGAAT